MSTGGELFEQYLTVASSFTSHRLWRAVCSTGDLADPATEQTLIDKEACRFHGWVLMQCGSIGAKGRRQLFYCSFMAKYHGLSRQGREILAQFGFMTKKSSFDKIFKEILAESKRRTRCV